MQFDWGHAQATSVTRGGLGRASIVSIVNPVYRVRGENDEVE
jgi:hypothetical protein